MKIKKIAFVMVVSMLLSSSVFAVEPMPKKLCIGDSDIATNDCFTGMWFDEKVSWKYVTDKKFLVFWNGNAFITTSTWTDVATWNFKVPVTGEVWFSAFIPSKNATARSVYYSASCQDPMDPYGGGGRVSKSIDQLNYSSKWVTIGKVGVFGKGSSCTVSVRKLSSLDRSNNEAKMAVDAMKMAIYKD